MEGLVHAVLKKGQRRAGWVTGWRVRLLTYLRSGSGVSTHHFVVLYQHHVVCAESSAKDDAGHALETMDPLLSLWPLATHIEHPVHHTESHNKVSQSASPGYHDAVRCRQFLLVSDFCSGPPCDLPEVQLFAGELFFNDTSCFDSRSQHVLLSGEVFWLADSVHFIEVADDGRANDTAISPQIWNRLYL